MAMFLFYNRVLVILLIKYLLIILCDNGLLTIGKTTVTANGNTIIKGPFIEIEKPQTTRLIITKPHQQHYLSCIATIGESDYSLNDTVYYYTWFRNGTIFDSFLVYINGTLRLPPTERASGIYRCKINANTTAMLSESITVEYPVLKRIPVAANISAFADLPLTFNCPVWSVPPANVTWFFGNVSLSKTFQDNSYLILANGSLVLRKLTLKDSGKYKCLARNQFAVKTHRQFMWTLTVEQPPSANGNAIAIRPNNAQFIPQLQNTTQYIPLGDAFRLLCYTLADTPDAKVEWWYQRNASAPLTKLANDSHEYYVPSSTEAHEGYYICSTTKDNQRYHVIVTTPPVMVKTLISYESMISAALTLSCSAKGNPRPTISWYHNGAPLNSSYTRYISGNELHIHSFDPDEDGIYQCFARNIAGEAYSAGEIRFRNRADEVVVQNPLHNIRCFAHSFNTINVTFDSKSAELLFVLHIVHRNPHRWSSHIPMQLNHTSYVIISKQLPIYRPFELITRVLFPTSEIRMGNKAQQQTMLSSLRSPPVTCCTQGLLVHLVHLGNDTFVTWSQPDLNSKKYFILQFSINYTHPHPQQQLRGRALRGTIQHVDLTQADVAQKLTEIEALNETATRMVLKGAEASTYSDNEARASHLETEEDIFNLIVPANVTGVLMQNFSRIKMRVLIITSENEHLAQDFRYVQWKIIENDTTESMNMPFHLTTVESRMLLFHFKDDFNETCIQVCHWLIQFPIINKEDPKCDKHTIENLQLAIKSLKPSERYRLNFFSCENHIFYGQLDVKTLPDPPGTISRQRVTRHNNGLKLRWDPPIQPNGKIHHYNILWTLGNVTHESNVLDCGTCFYKFPNISESAKINITVRVVGETGVGAPIFIDLRNINHLTLEQERDTSNSEVYSGIAIGSLLSTFCVFCFALLFIFQRRRLKTRQQGPTHLSSPSDMNFGNLNNPSIPGDSAGGLSGSTFQQDCHEMQTLIPKTGRHIEFLAERPNEYQTTQLPNGNGNILRRAGQLQGVSAEQELQNTSTQSGDYDVANLSQLPLCRRIAPTPKDANPYYITFKQVPPNTVVAAAVHKHSSSMNYPASGSGVALSPPATLSLVVVAGGSAGSNGAHRSGSLSSASAGSSSRSSSNSSKKQFHTNFPKHSKSNDGICLLADEESAATLTPTSEKEVTTLANGFKAKEENAATTNAPATNTNTGATVAASSGSSSGKRVNFNNNNSTKKKTTTASAAPLSSIVPAIGPAAAASAISATPALTAKHWVAAAAPKAKKTATSTASSSGGAHRRPNMDPNG